jgi:hypothetical protein
MVVSAVVVGLWNMSISRLDGFRIMRSITMRGTVVAQWLRYCATNQKVAGSIPDGVIGIFH